MDTPQPQQSAAPSLAELKFQAAELERALVQLKERLSTLER